MRSHAVLLLAGALFSLWAVVSTSATRETHLYGGNEPEMPGCVPKCWENSKYVSNCGNNHKCLCEDAQFQGAVLQCLHSQCQTAQFGSAIHHAMARCFEEDSHATQTLPALIRHQGFRKRQLSGPHASASVSASAVHSVARRPPSVSAPGNARPTRSATFTSLPGRITPFAMPTSLLPGLNTTVTYPAAA